MKLGILFSGGKDSVFACHLAQQTDEVRCLITLISKNKESYMFHTPNIGKCPMLAEAMGIPYLEWKTPGHEEEELGDLRDAIAHAIKEHGIEGVVTGAIESVYQATRVQRICDELGIWCFNPIWQIDQLRYLRILIAQGFNVIISGISAYPLEKEWIGRRLDERTIEELSELRERFSINPSGEGGEFETMVLDGPNFKKRIEVLESEVEYSNYSGTLVIRSSRLVGK